MLDLVIRDAQVFDGLGSAPVHADVGVQDGVVTQIGRLSERAQQEVSAQGLSLMPGIVDLHTHFDAQVTWDPSLSPSPGLGVTTAVMGNCGFGIAPCPAPLRETMIKNLSVVEGMDLHALRTGIQWEFESFADYLQQLRRIGPYLNTAVFAGHSVLRTAVMGEAGSTQVEPTDDQLATMCQLFRESMADGAIGLAGDLARLKRQGAAAPFEALFVNIEHFRFSFVIAREPDRFGPSLWSPYGTLPGGSSSSTKQSNG